VSTSVNTDRKNWILAQSLLMARYEPNLDTTSYLPQLSGDNSETPLHLISWQHLHFRHYLYRRWLIGNCTGNQENANRDISPLMEQFKMLESCRTGVEYI